MVTMQDNGPVQTSIDRLRAEMERLVDMARDRSGKALDAVGIKPPSAMMFPATDVVETNDAVHLVANLPGVSADLLDVNITGQLLRLRGSVVAPSHSQSGTVHRRERQAGPFERVYALPCGVNAEAAQAELSAGVLHIRLPKVADEVGYKIPVKSGEGDACSTSISTAVGE